MRVSSKKDTSPILLSFLHFLPSLMLVCLVVVAILALGFSERKTVLGAQSNTPQIRTLTVEDRLKELTGVASKVKSEAVKRAAEELKN